MLQLPINIIKNNTAGSGGGGGVYARSYSQAQTGTSGIVTLTNNIITNNSANVGGGVFASSYALYGSGGAVIFTNNTVSENSAADYGGGVYMYAYGDPLSTGIVNAYNNIIWNNSSSTGGKDIELGTSGGTRNSYNNDYHSLSGTWNGADSDNIDEDPFLLAGKNYRLRAGSPCIDTGDNSCPWLYSNDFEGDDRIIDGNNDSAAIVDMGADEYTRLSIISNIFMILFN